MQIITQKISFKNLMMGSSKISITNRKPVEIKKRDELYLSDFLLQIMNEK